MSHIARAARWKRSGSPLCARRQLAVSICYLHTRALTYSCMLSTDIRPSDDDDVYSVVNIHQFFFAPLRLGERWVSSFLALPHCWWCSGSLLHMCSQRSLTRCVSLNLRGTRQHICVDSVCHRLNGQDRYLYEAAVAGNVTQVQMLLAAGAHPDAYRKTQVLDRAAVTHAMAAAFSVQAFADTVVFADSNQDDFGSTALMQASQWARASGREHRRATVDQPLYADIACACRRVWQGV